MALHVLFAKNGTGAPYLIGEDGTLEVRVFDPARGSISAQPRAVQSVLAHMASVSFEEYTGSAEEEKALLEQAQAALDALAGAE